MRNPNDVEFVTRTTATHFVCEYGYSRQSMSYELDLASMRFVYGENKVTTEERNGRRWIIVSQPLYTDIIEKPVDATFSFSRVQY